MRLGVWFTILAVAAVGGGIQLGGWGLLLLAPGATLAACAAGYLGLGARVFGKRSDGSRGWWAKLLMAPYILPAWMIWRGLRFVRREPCCDELVPGLLMGRRLAAPELPDAVKTVVDLTAEMWEAAPIRNGRHYLARPILDGHVSDDESLLELVREIDALDGPVLFHCAEGRGRTGMVAAALLIHRRLADDLDRALALGRAQRPSLRLSPSQAALVRRLTPRLRSR